MTKTKFQKIGSTRTPDNDTREYPMDTTTRPAYRLLPERCASYARRGTGAGLCDRPLDEHGYCDRPSDHLESLPT